MIEGTLDAAVGTVRRAPPWVRWAAVGVVGVVLLAASVVPGGAGVPTTGPFGVLGPDEWLHAVGYLGLAAALTWALDRPAAVGAVLAVAGAVAYGVALEAVQASLATRAASTGDAVADAVGATVGALVVEAARRQRACASDRSTSAK